MKRAGYSRSTPSGQSLASAEWRSAGFALESPHAAHWDGGGRCRRCDWPRWSVHGTSAAHRARARCAPRRNADLRRRFDVDGTLDPQVTNYDSTIRVMLNVCEPLIWMADSDRVLSRSGRIMGSLGRRPDLHLQAQAGCDLPRRHPVQRRRRPVHLRPGRRGPQPHRGRQRSRSGKGHRPRAGIQPDRRLRSRRDRR